MLMVLHACPACCHAIILLHALSQAAVTFLSSREVVQPRNEMCVQVTILKREYSC